MNEHTIHELRREVRRAIARVESSAEGRPHDRTLQRVLAYLWMANDELELIGDVQLVPTP
jgi:hypothetical protein